jgi:mono/diheme cytochrome c family protein
LQRPKERHLIAVRSALRRLIHRRTLGAAIALGALVGGCYPPTAPPPNSVSAESVTWASAQWPGTTDTQLSRGRELFLAHCNACHGFPDLAKIDDARWPSILDKMAKKADLNPDQRESVLHFVLAARHH